jgi:hypothetical protein
MKYSHQHAHVIYAKKCFTNIHENEGFESKLFRKEIIFQPPPRSTEQTSSLQKITARVFNSESNLVA